MPRVSFIFFFFNTNFSTYLERKKNCQERRRMWNIHNPIIKLSVKKKEMRNKLYGKYVKTHV